MTSRPTCRWIPEPVSRRVEYAHIHMNEDPGCNDESSWEVGPASLSETTLTCMTCFSVG
jgi:hypothetical protein